uniref:Putative integrase protein n=1 Tax=Polaromonas sp. GM1 TaxID=480424 RepID=L0LEH5_9BURK|nr:putative integrase protein [Polaromonas sp. GM1]
MEDFPEAEQLEAYRAEFGTITQRQSRRARLIAKQLDALRVLNCWRRSSQRLATQLPPGFIPTWRPSWKQQALLRCGHWLRRSTEKVNVGGSIFARLGNTRQHALRSGCARMRTVFGLAIGAHVRVARRTLQSAALQAVVLRETSVVPIDKLIVPAALNGSDGHYRSPRHLCMLNADNDYEALLIWIKSRQSPTPEEIPVRKTKRRIDPAAPQGPLDWLQYLSHTQRAYLKEAERFLLWAVVERQKPLSSMSLEDCEAYRAFITNPLPAERWCGPNGGVEKWFSRWRHVGSIKCLLPPRRYEHFAMGLDDLCIRTWVKAQIKGLGCIHQK